MKKQNGIKRNDDTGTESANNICNANTIVMQPLKRKTDNKMHDRDKPGVTVVRWHGRARGAIAPSLNFLVTFSFKRKSNRTFEITSAPQTIFSSSLVNSKIQFYTSKTLVPVSIPHFQIFQPLTYHSQTNF